MPLVAFDKKGNRLGMGAGYYDRTFGTLSNQKIKLFGLGFEVQQVDAIPTEEWDIALDGMITEKRIIIF